MHAGFTERWFGLLFAGGLSVMVHGAVAVYALVAEIEVDAPPPLEIVVLDELPEQAASTSVDGPVEAFPVEPPPPVDGAGERGDPSSATALDDDGKKERWRERLARLNAEYDQKERAADARLAVLRRALGPVAKQAGVRRCGPAGLDGPVLDKSPTRSLGRLSPLLPDGVMNAAYLERVGELSRSHRQGRLSFELALPAELLRIRLDEPADTLVTVGRADTQCAVRIVISRDLFPVRFEGLPVHVVTADNRVLQAVVDFDLRVDATVRIVRQEGDFLGFSQVTLRRAEELSHKLEGHQAVFRALKALAGTD